MPDIDLNLLIALDVLLAEESVTRAAQRLNLSTSAMSRTLKRLREATGDPLLVRAGRSLVPTPYAQTLGVPVHELVRQAQTVLQPPTDRLDLATLDRLFTLRTNAAFVRMLGPALIQRVAVAAPRARLRFAPRPDKAATALREGHTDIEIGVPDAPAPEIRSRPLFDDRYIAVARSGHPHLAAGGLSAADFAELGHIAVSSDGRLTGPVDDAFDGHGLTRNVRVVVPDFADALRIARQSDGVALVPRSCLGHALIDSPGAPSGLDVFAPPIAPPAFTVCLQWHPRMEADPAHRWLRDVVTTLCAEAYPP